MSNAAAHECFSQHKCDQSVLPACSFSTCVTPRDSTSPTSRRGTLYYTQRIKLTFSGLQFCSRFFSRSRLRGTQVVRLYTTAQVWVRDGLHGACSGRSESEIWQATTGSFSAELETSETMETHISVFYVCFSATAVQPRSHGTTLASNFPRCYSHGHYLYMRTFMRV